MGAFDVAGAVAAVVAGGIGLWLGQTSSLPPEPGPAPVTVTGAPSPAPAST